MPPINLICEERMYSAKIDIGQGVPTKPEDAVMSPPGSSEFGRMLEAFSAARVMRRTLTLNALRGMLIISAQTGPMTYAEFSECSRFSDNPKLNYMIGASLIAQLSDGRGNYPGLRLCERHPGADRRQKVVVIGRDGRAMTRHFLNAAGIACPSLGRDWIGARLLPALDAVIDRDAGLALSTFCVLLDIAHNAERFEGGAESVSKISKRLGVNNLPNHIARLSGMPRGRNGPNTHPALITMHGVPHDQRARWPALNERGREMMTAFAERLSVAPEQISA
ncbi:hypothetical protein [Paracoccus sp. ME4]|uniref:hypothetical protein n=1 Tax=Paracoccus sp. ME4 TaxID=3138066 RepID=UPI00398B2FF9